MTCDECLRLVSVADRRDLSGTTAIARHCAGCASCTAAVQTIYRDTAEMANLLNAITSGIDPRVIAYQATAKTLARRQRVKSMRLVAFAMLALMIPMVAIPLAVGTFGETPRPTKTYVLRCLSGEQALALVHPLLDDRSRAGTRTSGLASITVTASPDQLAAVDRQLQRYDNKATAPQSTNPVCALELDGR